MSALQLQNLSAIIIDDHPEMCKQLHLMLERLGLRRIVSAHSGEKAIELIAKADFNLILCDFDLGRGKNGLQVLEECRHRHIIKNTSCFIMISAVQTGELVLGAIENQPDAYIIKPITFDDLRLRLERTINIKDTYYDIFHNIDKKNYSAALSACNLLLKQRPKLSLSVLKHKARLYCLMDDHIKAEKMYSEILNIRTLAWAQLGLAKTCLALNKLEQAQHLLEQLIRQHKSHIPAYDLLAEIKALRGDTVGAQGALETALQYSPCSVRRQSFLSKLAIENQDWDAAMISSRRGIDLGKYSMFCSADNYIHLTAALKPQLNSESLSKRRAASIEIFKTVEGLKKDFKSDPVVLVSAHFIEGSTHKQLGQTKESEKCILVATELIKQNNLDQRSQDLQLIGQRMSLACDADTLKDFIDSDICTNLSNDFKKNLQKVKNQQHTMKLMSLNQKLTLSINLIIRVCSFLNRAH